MAKYVTAVVGLGSLFTWMAPSAQAGCVDVPKSPAAFHSSPAWAGPARWLPVSESDASPAGASIVGLWKVTFVARGNPGIPDGATIDWGYAQWHSDGTEIMNSGGRAPATENFCLGVWKKTGPSSYRLNHLALSYDAISGTLNGKVTIREDVTTDRGGNNFAGTFTIAIHDPNGNLVAQIAGDITGERVTVD